MSSQRVAALLPMRHNSERVPGKNYRQLGDAPLFHHVARTLLASSWVDEVIIDTDSPVIKSQCAEHFPTVKIVNRPIDLTDGEIPMNRIIEHDLDFTDAEVILQTHSTNPFLTTGTIDKAISLYHSNNKIDSVFTVTRLQQRLWKAGSVPVNHDPEVLLRTQDLEPLYIENSCVFVFSRNLIIDTGCRIGPKSAMLEMDAAEAVDIDEESDFSLAEAMWAASVQGLKL